MRLRTHDLILGALLRWAAPLVAAIFVLAAHGAPAFASTVTQNASVAYPGAVIQDTHCWYNGGSWNEPSPAWNTNCSSTPEALIGPGATLQSTSYGAQPCFSYEASSSDNDGDQDNSQSTEYCVTPFTSNNTGTSLAGTYQDISVPTPPAGASTIHITSASLGVSLTNFDFPNSTYNNTGQLQVEAACGGPGGVGALGTPDASVTVTLPPSGTNTETVTLPATQALRQVLDDTHCSDGTHGAPEGAYLAITASYGHYWQDDATLTVQSLSYSYYFAAGNTVTVKATAPYPGSIVPWEAPNVPSSGTAPVAGGPASSPSASDPVCVAQPLSVPGAPSGVLFDVTNPCVTQFTSDADIGSSASVPLSGTYTNIPAPAGALIAAASLTVAVANAPNASSPVAIALRVEAGCGATDTKLAAPATDTVVTLETGSTVTLPATKALQQVLANPTCSTGDNGAPQGAYLAIAPSDLGGYIGPFTLSVQSLTFTYIVPPTGVAVAPNTSAAQQGVLTWNPNGNPSDVTYVVHEVIQGGGHAGNSREVYVGSATDFVGSGLACGEYTQYQVATRTTGGATTAAVSSPWFATTPCSVGASTAGATALNVSWPTISGPSYVVFWCAANACSSPSDNVGGAGSHTISGLVPNTEYTVWACTTTDTAYCPSQSLWTDAAVPTDLTATVTQTGIAIGWSPNGNPQGTSYEVVLQGACGGPGTWLQSAKVSPTPLGYTFSGLEPGTTYHVNVAAYSTGTGATTAYDGQCGVDTSAWPSIPSVTATEAGAAQQATLSWSAVSVSGAPTGPTYVLQRETLNPSGSTVVSAWSTVYTGAETSFSSTGQACGNGYLYRVQPQEVQADWTDSLLWLSTPCPPAFTATVGGLGWVPSGGRGYVHLAWSPVAGATGYRVWVYDGASYENFDVGDATSWDSRSAGIFPPDLSLYPNVSEGSQPAPVFLHGGGGLDLRDLPQDLYCTVTGTGYCNDATETYWFTVSAYNATGDSNLPTGSGNPCFGVSGVQCYQPTLPLQTDPNAPSISTFQINGGASDTYQAQVNLTIDASESPSGVAAYAVSNDGTNWTTVDISGCQVGQVAACATSWGATVPWTLTPGTGSKMVYVKVESTAGVWSTAHTASIESIQDPAHLVVDATLNGGAASTTSTSVTLGVTVTDSGVQSPTFSMRTSTNGGQTWTGWTAEGTGTSWTATETIPGGASGERTVLVQVNDQYSNVGQGGATIEYVSPGQPEAGGVSPGSIRICTWPVGSGTVAATCVVQPQVDVALAPPSGTVQMRASLDGVLWGPWEAVKTSIAVSLSPSPGPQTVWVQYRDAAGTVTAAPHHNPAYFVYDPAPPTVQAAWLGNASATDSNGQATLVVQASDDVGSSGALGVTVTESGAVLYQGAYQNSIPLTLSGAGYQVVQVTVRDVAGNTTSVTMGIYVE